MIISGISLLKSDIIMIQDGHSNPNTINFILLLLNKTFFWYNYIDCMNYVLYPVFCNCIVFVKDFWIQPIWLPLMLIDKSFQLTTILSLNYNKFNGQNLIMLPSKGQNLIVYF